MMTKLTDRKPRRSSCNFWIESACAITHLQQSESWKKHLAAISFCFFSLNLEEVMIRTGQAEAHLRRDRKVAEKYVQYI